MQTSDAAWKCPHCAGFHPQSKCPTIKAIEYYPDGTTKRIEFYSPSDYLAQHPLGSQVSYSGGRGTPATFKGS